MKEAKKILSSNAIVFAGTLVGGIFSYLFNMLAGRWLGPAQYGEFSALLSLLMILSVGGSAVMTITMRYAGELHAKGYYSSLRHLLKTFTRYMLFFGVGLLLIGAIFIRPIAGFLATDNLLPLAIVMLNFVFGFLTVVNRGVLQGAQRFLSVSGIGALEMILRLAIGILLIKLGFEITGAILGVVLATAVAYGVAFLPIWKLFREGGQDTKEKIEFDKKEIISYSWPTLVATTLLVLAFNIDVILVKHYFDAHEAGLYAAISTIAKVIFFITGPMAGVMFPIIAEHRAKGEKHYRVFLFSLVLTLAGALIVQGVYVVMPGTAIRILYGTAYDSFYHLLPLTGFVVVLYSLVNTVTNYFISVRNFIFLPFFALVLVLQIISVALYHPSIESVVKIFIAGQGLIFTFLLGYYLLTKREQLLAYLRGEHGQS